MPYTLGDLTTRVQNRVKDTGFSSTLVNEYLNDAQNDVFNEYRLPFMEATQAYTLTANDSDITSGNGLPSNYVQAINLTLTTNDKEKQLIYMPFQTIDQDYPDPDDDTTGTPNYWYDYDETIRVYPEPDQGYTVSLKYYKKPTEMTSDDDVPEVPSQFAELLVLGAAYRVLQVKDNYDQAAILENKYNEHLVKLAVRYSQAQVGTPTVMRINRRELGKQNF